jgi:hypothetical protein
VLQLSRSLADFRFIRGDQQVEAVLCALVSELETDAGGGTRYNGKLPCSSGMSVLL